MRTRTMSRDRKRERDLKIWPRDHVGLENLTSLMLTELNWQLLTERRRTARLVMFYKIHYHLVAITMPLESKMFLFPTRTENSLAYVITASYCGV